MQKLKALDKQLRSNSESEDISEIFSKEQTVEKKQQMEEAFDVFDLNHFSKFSDSLKEVPEHWTLCSLSLSVDCEYAFLTRTVSNSAPLTVRISLQSEESGKDELDEDRSNLYFDLRSRFDQIMEDSKKSHVSKDNKLAKSKWTEWWETRASLDQKLGRLLYDLENVLLGHFKSLMCGSISDERALESLKKACPRIQVINTPEETQIISFQLKEHAVRKWMNL